MQELNIEKIKSGDKEELQGLFEILLPRIRYLVRRSSRSAPDIDVEDLVQEVILRIYSNLHKFDSTRGHPFLAWCNGVAKNVIYEYWRRERLMIIGPLDIDEVDAENLPESQRQQESIDLTRILEEAIKTLSPDQRKMVQLRFEGKMIGEIAEELGITRATAHRRYLKALETLQALVLAEPNLRKRRVE